MMLITNYRIANNVIHPRWRVELTVTVYRVTESPEPLHLGVMYVIIV